MSVHSSLTSKDKGKRRRSVLKRFEKLKQLYEKEKWGPSESVFGLPKIKTVRWKLKKAKKAAEAETESTSEESAKTADKKGPMSTSASEKSKASGKKQ